MLQLLEYQKHQLAQVIALINSLPGRTSTECLPQVPEGVEFPFSTLDEVENFEEWLKDPRNSSKKNNLV